MSDPCRSPLLLGTQFAHGPPNSPGFPPTFQTLSGLFPPPTTPLLSSLVHSNTDYTLITTPTVLSPAWASSELQIWGPAAPPHHHGERSQTFHIQCGHSEPDCSLNLLPPFLCLPPLTFLCPSLSFWGCRPQLGSHPHILPSHIQLIS